MAARPVGVWGIDLGQCALKAVRLEMKGGEVVATAFEYVEHPKILSQPDADPDELIREALEQFLSRNNIRGDIMAISVPGQSGLARFVKLPPVNQSKIADIVKFEAKQQIPFPLDEVVWDFQPLSTGEVVDGMALETEIGLFAMKRDMVNRAINQFKVVNVEVHLVQMAPLALCNFVAFDLLGKDAGAPAGEDEDHSCIVALEIGTDSSNLVITDGGKIIWQRPIPIGGNHFTRALTKEMKLTFAKAEHLKRNAAKSPELKKILSALKQVLNDFVGEVQRSLGFFTNTHRNAEIQYMIGLGNAFRLPGLQKFLQEKLQLEVRKLHELQRATGESVTGSPTFAENIMSFGVAYGLALQGLKQTRLQTNLLPYEVRLERIVRGKKPWFVTAAATLLVGMLMLTYARGKEKEAYNNKPLKDAVNGLKTATSKAETYKKDFKAANENVDKQIDELARIGAGVGERLNWQLLLEYVNYVMPQPNGDRLVVEGSNQQNPHGRYWNKHAQEAFRLWQLRKVRDAHNTPNADALQKEEVFVKQNLIQINIIGVNALYSDDLGPYYRKIQKDGDALIGMSQDEKQQILDFLGKDNDNDRASTKLIKDSRAGKGWVVEIRGYTYHKDKNVFINDTLIENLKAPDKMRDANRKELPALTAEMKSRVVGRIGFMNLYLIKDMPNKDVPRPVAGKFEYIDKSNLPVLIKGIEAKGPANAQGGQPPPPQGAGGANAPVKLDRNAWKPLGETASGGLAINNAQANAGNNTPVPLATARTEFVLLFVWREPLPAAPSATDKK